VIRNVTVLHRTEFSTNWDIRNFVGLYAVVFTTSFNGRR